MTTVCENIQRDLSPYLISITVKEHFNTKSIIDLNTIIHNTFKLSIFDKTLINDIYIKNGYDKTCTYIVEVLLKYMDKLIIDNNFKGQIVRYAQKFKQTLPMFTYEKIENELKYTVGENGIREYELICTVNMDGILETGKGNNKKKASQEACKNLIKRLMIDDTNNIQSIINRTNM